MECFKQFSHISPYSLMDHCLPELHMSGTNPLYNIYWLSTVCRSSLIGHWKHPDFVQGAINFTVALSISFTFYQVNFHFLNLHNLCDVVYRMDQGRPHPCWNHTRIPVVSAEINHEICVSHLPHKLQKICSRLINFENIEAKHQQSL